MPAAAPSAVRAAASPARPLPKRKSAPTTTWRKPEPGREDVKDEGLGAEPGEACVERKLVEHLDPELRQPPRPGVGGHQPECGRVGGEERSRVRLEGDDAERCVELGRRGVGQRQHRLVAEMHAVEVAHRDGRSAVIGSEAAVVVKSPHPAPSRDRQAPSVASQSNLRLGASTSASPSSTTLSPTRQEQSSVTRRREWSISRTRTVASTRSPGRTGALNLSVWPR